MLIKWLEANLWRSAAMALAIYAAMLLVQIHGMPIIGGGLKPALEACEGNLKAVLRAQAEAEALQAAFNEDEERRSAANAQRSEVSHDQDQTRAVVASRSYAAAHRIAAGGLRGQADGGEASQAPATAEGDGAGISAEVPADPLVAVSSPDLQAYTAAVTYAVAAHNWAATINRNEAGSPPEPPVEH